MARLENETKVPKEVKGFEILPGFCCGSHTPPSRLSDCVQSVSRLSKEGEVRPEKCVTPLRSHDWGGLCSEEESPTATAGVTMGPKKEPDWGCVCVIISSLYRPIPVSISVYVSVYKHAVRAESSVQ